MFMEPLACRIIYWNQMLLTDENHWWEFWFLISGSNSTDSGQNCKTSILPQEFSFYPRSHNFLFTEMETKFIRELLSTANIFKELNSSVWILNLIYIEFIIKE